MLYLTIVIEIFNRNIYFDFIYYLVMIKFLSLVLDSDCHDISGITPNYYVISDSR